MDSDLRLRIHNDLNLKETGELLEIWKTNDRLTWTDTTFEVIEEILTGRGIKIPNQDEPVYEHYEESDNYGFTDEEIKILDDNDPPDFYDPLDVLVVCKWIERAAIASGVVAMFSNFLQFPATRGLVQSYFRGSPLWDVVSYLLAFGITAASVLMVIIVTYFPLMAMARILKILMQMEFNSRRAK